MKLEVYGLFSFLQHNVNYVVIPSAARIALWFKTIKDGK